MDFLRKIIITVLIAIFSIIFFNGYDVYAVETTTATTTAPKYDITINIVPEKGWKVKTSKVDVKIYDNGITGTFRVKKVEARIGNDGEWQDITDDRVVEVSENCTVYVQVTDAYGTVYTKSRYINKYDTTPPSLNCAVNNGVLTVDTHDADSGVKKVYINGYKYTPDSSGKVRVRLQKFDASYANFTVYAVDKVGNESEPYTIENPYHKESSGDDEGGDGEESNPADSLPADATTNVTGDSAASITSVTNQNCKDISNKVTKKQFYNIVTQDGQEYYLVIDMTSTLDQGENDFNGVSEGTVYFLKSVSNNDLLNFTNSGEDAEVTLGYNSVAASNMIDDDEELTDEERAGLEEAENEEKDGKEKKKDEKKKSGGSSSLIFIVLIAVAVVVVLVKLKGGKKGTIKTDEDLYPDEIEEEEEDFFSDDNSNDLSELNEEEEEV